MKKIMKFFGLARHAYVCNAVGRLSAVFAGASRWIADSCSAGYCEEYRVVDWADHNCCELFTGCIFSRRAATKFLKMCAERVYVGDIPIGVGYGGLVARCWSYCLGGFFIRRYSIWIKAFWGHCWELLYDCTSAEEQWRDRQRIIANDPKMHRYLGHLRNSAETWS